MADPELENKSKTPPSRDDVKQENGDLKRERARTAILSLNSRFRRLTPTGAPGATASLDEDQREILLLIRGIVERLLLSENMPIILGRSDLSTRYHPDVDLTPYGALDRGVSRAHARLHLEGRKLYVTDLGSTNGTFIGGKRLTPHQPELLRKGDELLLGRLGVQVLFK